MFVFDKTNFVEEPDGEVYSVRGCAPPSICKPGKKNRTDGTVITTKCCKNDLCINLMHFQISRIVHSGSNRRDVDITFVVSLLVILSVSNFCYY